MFFSQLVPAAGLDLDPKFRTLVYQSIVAPLPPEGPGTAVVRPAAVPPRR